MNKEERYVIRFDPEQISDDVVDLSTVAIFSGDHDLRVAASLVVVSCSLYDQEFNCFVPPNEALEILQKRYLGREMDMFRDYQKQIELYVLKEDLKERRS